MVSLKIDELFLYPVRYGLVHLEKQALLLDGQRGGFHKQGHKFSDKGFFSATKFLREEIQNRHIEADLSRFHWDISWTMEH